MKEVLRKETKLKRDIKETRKRKLSFAGQVLRRSENMVKDRIEAEYRNHEKEVNGG